MPAEGEDLDRHCPGRAELVGKFGLVDHDDQALSGLGDDFFPQQRAAAAFDHVEIGIDFIGAVDGQVDARMMLECAERNAESLGIGFGGQRGGDGDDIAQLSALNALGDAAGGEDGGTAGA